MSVSVEQALSHFGVQLKAKLSNPAISGGPEDQLRAPLDQLVRHLAAVSGLPAGAVDLVGETRQGNTRPDFAVTCQKALVGFIEVKAPGKGADPRKFTDAHDKDQWARLKSLPNLLYTDGNSFSLWRDGELQGKIVHLDGDVETSGAKLAAPPTLVPLLADFLGWKPIPPRNARGLAEVAARLCRLLRDQVTEELAEGQQGLADLRKDWRKMLFPDADDRQFADGYAQAVTFGLLVARARDISLGDGIHKAAFELSSSATLIGAALKLLTDDPSIYKALKTSLDTLGRVLAEVNWHTISKDRADAWLYFYEEFLAVYDNTLRKRTGSYYTPPEVVNAMVRLVDEVLRGPLFERSRGLASDDVVVADPAVGTGTFLLGVLRRVADSVRADQGPGAVKGAIRAMASRLIGFEIQFGPFAVAQLRLTAELQALLASKADPSPTLPDLRLFITDTLGNPFVEEEFLLQSGAIAQSRKQANKVKRDEPITVVIGNPPYKEKADGRGGWVEAGSEGRDAAMERWRPPAAWKVGAHAKHLKNLYVYFWRWATWKVFGSGDGVATGRTEADRSGVVCFITVAGFLNGPGFQRMRDDLRRTCSDIWVIDCSPEGHQPEVATRIFEGVQQPVCIVLAARKLGRSAETPARLRFRSLPEGRRQTKFDALAALSLEDAGWVDGPTDWRSPFLPAAKGLWSRLPSLESLFHFFGPGVMPGRTWVVAPDRQSLVRRWEVLIGEGDPEAKERLFHPQLRDNKVAGRHIRKIVKEPLGSIQTRPISISVDKGDCPGAIRYAARSFDRQWIIGDARLINDIRAKLWSSQSIYQIFATALEAHSPESGPALTFAGLVPDQHHYKGSFGGRVYPLPGESGEGFTVIRA